MSSISYIASECLDCFWLLMHVVQFTLPAFLWEIMCASVLVSWMDQYAIDCRLHEEHMNRLERQRQDMTGQLEAKDRYMHMQAKSVSYIFHL